MTRKWWHKLRQLPCLMTQKDICWLLGNNWGGNRREWGLLREIKAVSRTTVIIENACSLRKPFQKLIVAQIILSHVITCYSDRVCWQNSDAIEDVARFIRIVALQIDSINTSVRNETCHEQFWRETYVVKKLHLFWTSAWAQMSKPPIIVLSCSQSQFICSLGL